MHDPRYPPVSRPASDFGAARRPPPGTGFDAAGLASLEVVCPRPVHHVLQYAALYRWLERLRGTALGCALRVWLRSALRESAPFAELPAERVERLPALAELRGKLEATLRPGERGAVLCGTDAGYQDVLGDLELVTAPELDYRDGSPESAAGAAASGRFYEALAAASPRWLAAPGAELPVRLPPSPSFLVHQARFHLGDTLWLTPLLRALRRFFPASRVTLVGPPAAELALAENPHLTELVVYDPGAERAARRSITSTLSARSFDAALFALARRPESRWLAEATAEMGVPCRVNLEYFWEADDGQRVDAPFTHEGFLFWGTRASPRFLLHLLDPFVDGGEHLADRRLLFPVLPAWRDAAARWLAGHGLGEEPFAVLAPGGKSSERWPAERFAELAGRLGHELGWHVVLEGSREERPLLDDIAAAARPPVGRRVTVAPEARPTTTVAASPLGVMAALLARARLLVANDSAAIHLAETAGTPTLYFAQHEKITHSHPAGPSCWALYDDLGNRVEAISVAQVMGALDEMRGCGDL